MTWEFLLCAKAPPVVTVQQFKPYGNWVVQVDGRAVATFSWREEGKANGLARRLMDGSGQPAGGTQPLN